MNDQSLRLGKAKQLCLKTTPFFSREREELPHVGLEPALFGIHVRIITLLESGLGDGAKNSTDER